MADDIPLNESGAARIAEIAERREVTARAAATPLPGALADAFSFQPDIKAGKYTVRPFCEADFEYLQALEHPMHEILIATFSGKETNADYFSSGQKAWELCYLLTHSIDELDNLFKAGKQGFKDTAANEFRRLPFGSVSIIHAAAVKQVMDASKAAVGYAASEDDDGSKKNAAT